MRAALQHRVGHIEKLCVDTKYRHEECAGSPELLYFATALPVKGKIFDLLGEFSIYIYLAQCPVLISYYFGNRDTTAQFPLFCICILLMFLLNRVVNRLKKPKALN